MREEGERKRGRERGGGDRDGGEREREREKVHKLLFTKCMNLRSILWQSWESNVAYLSVEKEKKMPCTCTCTLFPGWTYTTSFERLTTGLKLELDCWGVVPFFPPAPFSFFTLLAEPGLELGRSSNFSMLFIIEMYGQALSDSGQLSRRMVARTTYLWAMAGRTSPVITCTDCYKSGTLMAVASIINRDKHLLLIPDWLLISTGAVYSFLFPEFPPL